MYAYEADEIDQLRKALDELIHAIEDDVDDYPRMEEACKKAKLLLPEYMEKPIYG